MTATCSNCPFWEQATKEDGATGPTDGWCHHISNALNPNMDSEGWWCSAHPLSPGRVHELAAMAMQAQISNPDWIGSSAKLGWSYVETSRSAYGQARAMLAEAEKESGHE